MSTRGQTFVVRSATTQDMPAIVGIYNWAINQTFATIDSEPLSREEAAEWWDTHAGKTIYQTSWLAVALLDRKASDGCARQRDSRHCALQSCSM